MTKRIQSELTNLKYNNQELKLNLGTLAIVAACVFLLIIATLTQLKFNHGWILSFHSSENVWQYLYVPQVPVLMFIAAILGRRFSILAIIIYIICGMFFPVFALGGGIKYALQYNFGFILAYIPAVFLASLVLAKEYSPKNIVKASLLCVASVYIVGMLYMFLIAIVRHSSLASIYEFLILQNGLKIIYDFILCIVAAFLAKPLKHLLWLVVG